MAGLPGRLWVSGRSRATAKRAGPLTDDEQIDLAHVLHQLMRPRPGVKDIEGDDEEVAMTDRGAQQQHHQGSESAID